MEKLNKNTDNNDNKDNKEENTDKNKKTNENLSEEEKEYKQNISDMVDALLDKDLGIKQNAYNMLKSEITQSTGSMTSIPKPLKFFREHYSRLRDAYTNEANSNPNSEGKKIYGDLLSILVLVTDTEDTSLQFVLENNLTDFYEWGQEYVRSLSGEITTEYLKRLDEDKPFDDIIALVDKVSSTLIKSNNENEAVDLLVELDLVDNIKQLCNATNYKKICSYLLAISNFAADSTEQKKILEIVFEIYKKNDEHTNALRVALKLKDKVLIKSVFQNCPTKSTKYQMAYILARTNTIIESDDLDDDISEIIKNLKTSDTFKLLGRSLDILQPKHPEDIFKSHLEDKKEGIQLESYKINMSTSIVSAFINAGFGTESLLSKKDDEWLAKNKEEGLLCALAGLGLVNKWDIECGPNEVEKFMDVNEMDPFKRGGFNIALGIMNSGVVDDNATCLAILSEQTKDKK